MGHKGTRMKLIPLDNNMAAVAFIGSTRDEQQLAKEFWKGVSYPDEGDGKWRKIVAGKAELTIWKSSHAIDSMENKALKRFWSEVEKREKTDEEEKFHTFSKFKSENQLLLQRRREERIKREEISKTILNNEELLEYDVGEEEGSHDLDAIEAFRDMNDFDKRLKRT